MGTSQSSNGPKSGIPMVPPWVPDVDDTQPSQSDEGVSPDTEDIQIDNAPPPAIELAPRGRFSSVRRNIGSYAVHGDSNDMKKALGHYVSRSYGGKTGAVKRFGSTISTAEHIFGILSSASQGISHQQFDVNLLAGASVDQITDTLINSVRPTDGTQDTEASRFAIKEAVAQMLEQFSDADLLNLSEDQRLFVVERYIALDVFKRFELDVGKTILAKAATSTIALHRLKSIREFVRESVSSIFRSIGFDRRAVSPSAVKALTQELLGDLFDVFDSYLR